MPNAKKLNSVTPEINRENNLSRNILTLIKRSNISEVELAKALEIPYNTVHRLINGTTTDPKISTLKMIADYFNINLDSLIHGDDPSVSSKANKNIASVPIVNWDLLSSDNFIESIASSNWTSWQPVPLVSTEEMGENSYAIESKKSMAPRFPLGTIFIIDPNAKPIDSDLVLIKMKNNSGVSLRELIIDPPTWQLCPISSKAPSLAFCKEEHSIIGIVLFTIFKSRNK